MGDRVSGQDSGAYPVLRFVGQPIIDVGVATIVALRGRGTPDEVDADDLVDVSDFVAKNYTDGPLKSFLTSVFPNSAYVNPTMGVDKRAATMMHYLKGYFEPTADNAAPCVFCGRASYEKAFRQHLPLIAGEGVINFGPNGRTGLPMCGGCMLAAQVFPLGCAIKCEGRALLVHSDNPALTQAFAAEFLNRNQQFLSLADAASERIAYPRTITISLLLQIDTAREDHDDLIGSLTAYHLTNYGQNPDVTIFFLPSEVVSFLRTARGDMYRRAWQTIVARGWIRPKPANSGGSAQGLDASQTASDQPMAFGKLRNRVFEDLFTAKDNGSRFVRRYLLRGAASEDGEDATDDNDASDRRFAGVSWALTSLFLRKVLGMERYRIEAISRCGERLAEAIEADTDKSLLRNLYMTKSYQYLRNLLIKANSRRLQADAPPVITFDDFITIFEDSEDLPRVDWWLERDLMYIRVLDALYAAGWFRKNAEAAAEVLKEIEEAPEPEEAAVIRSV